MDGPRIKPAIALSEAEERDAYPHPGRRLSKYEPVSREKPLPMIPAATSAGSGAVEGDATASSRELRRKSKMRIPSHRRGQSYSELQSLSQSSAALFGTSPPQDPSIIYAPRETTSMQTLKTSAPVRTMNRAASFSTSPLPPPGASGHRSSRKISQLIGHDVDVAADDPYGLNHKASFTYAAEYFEGTSSSSASAGSGSGSGSGSDSDEGADGHCFNMEEGLLPLLEEDEEGFSSRENSWVPRTPGTGVFPPPLNIRRHGSSPSVGSGSISNSEFSPIHPTGTNFSLSSGSHMRWEPSYGHFTDKRAANDYHRFASQLATSPQRHTIIETASAEKHTKKPRSYGRLRFSGTSAIYRLWDSPLASSNSAKVGPPPLPPSLPTLPPPLPPRAPPAEPVATPAATPTTTSVRRNTLRKQRPARLSTVEKAAPLHAPAPPSPVTPVLQKQSQPPPVPPKDASPCSAFDFDSDDEDGGRSPGRKWWRRSDEEERGSSEWPEVQWAKKPEEEKEKTSFGGRVNGLFANARDRALLSPAERRRSELRKSIKVLRSPGLEKDSRRGRH